MKEIKLRNDARADTKGYYPEVNKDGVMLCSCGRQLIKLDGNAYKCSGGYPIFRFEDGSIIMDKFGNLMLRNKAH